MRATPTADEWEPIANLPEAWPDLRRDDLQVVHQQWKAEKAILKDPEKIQKLEEALGTAWAIETGIIERLYVLDRGITETLNLVLSTSISFTKGEQSLKMQFD